MLLTHHGFAEHLPVHLLIGHDFAFCPPLQVAEHIRRNPVLIFLITNMQSARNALRLTSQVGRLPIFQTRGVAMEGVKGFAENEKTIEDLYFTQVRR